MHVVVTGGSGLIGRHLLAMLNQIGATALSVGRSRNRTTHGITWTDLETFNFTRFPVDAIVHLASENGTPAWNQDPSGVAAQQEAALEALTHFALRASKKRPIAVVGASTATVVGPVNGPISESTPADAQTLYDAWKLHQEQVLADLASEVIRATSLRVPNVFGHFQQSMAAGRGFLSKTIDAAITEGRLTVYSGYQMRRDYLHVLDVCSAFISAISETAVLNTHYVIGTGLGVPMSAALQQIQAAVEELTDRPVTIEVVPPPLGIHPIDLRDVWMNASKFSKATGWTPTRNFTDGIRHMIMQALEIRSE